MGDEIYFSLDKSIMSSVHQGEANDDINTLKKETKEYVSVVAYGSQGVGKSRLIATFVKGFVREEIDPTIEESYEKEFQVDNSTFLLNILDTINEEYPSTSVLRQITKQNQKGGLFLLFFDLTYLNTLNDLPNVLEDILRAKDVDECPMVLIGTKCDLIEDKDIKYDEIEKFCQQYRVPFIKTSSKNSINVYETFILGIEQYKFYQRKTPPKPNMNNSFQCQFM